MPAGDCTAAATAGQVQLRCTSAEFEKLDPAEESQFIPGTGSYAGYGSGRVSYWPNYGTGMGGVGTGGVGVGGLGMGGVGMGSMDLAGGNPSRTVTYDSVPVGEVEIRRGDHVQATDGDARERRYWMTTSGPTPRCSATPAPNGLPGTSCPPAASGSPGSAPPRSSPPP